MKAAALCLIMIHAWVGPIFFQPPTSTPTPGPRERLTELRRETPPPEAGSESAADMEKVRPLWTAYWEKEQPRLLALAGACEQLLAASPPPADAAALEHEMAEAYLTLIGSVGPGSKTARDRIDALLARPGLNPDTAAQFYGFQMNMIAILADGDNLNEIVPVPRGETWIADRIRQVIEKFAARYPGTPALGRLYFSGAGFLSPGGSLARGGDTLALRETWLQQAERYGNEDTRREVATVRTRAAAIGHDAPPLAFTALDGRKVSLADLKGKVVVIDFWATWCGPCVQALPAVRGLYARDHARGLEIIGVSLDHDREKLAAFVRGHDLPWPQGFDGNGWDSALAAPFGVRSIPETWIIDPAGKVAAISPDDLSAEVEALLPKP